MGSGNGFAKWLEFIDWLHDQFAGDPCTLRVIDHTLGSVAVDPADLARELEMSVKELEDAILKIHAKAACYPREWVSGKDAC